MVEHSSGSGCSSAIHRINYYPEWINIRETSCPIHWIEIYQVDSIIHLSNNWALDIYFLYCLRKFVSELIEYACISTQKSRALIRKKLHHCQRTKVWWTWRVSFRPLSEKKNCMLITRLSGRDDICNDFIIPLASVFQCVLTLALISASRWLTEIWQLSWQRATGELEVEFKFQRCNCEALLPFPTLPPEHAGELACRLTS